MSLVDIIEIAGSLLILSGFAAAQRGLLDLRSASYLGLNAVGAAALALVALQHRSWGFLLLEGTWAIVSTVSLAGVLRRRRRGGRHADGRRGAQIGGQGSGGQSWSGRG